MQKDYRTDTWEEFNGVIKDKKLYIFGAAGAEKLLYDIKKYSCPWKLTGVVDNDRAKWGNLLETGIAVSNPDILYKENIDNIVVLICGMHTGEIGKQLESMGIQNYYSEFWMSAEMKDYYKLETDNEKINLLKNCLADQRSKDVVDAIVEKKNSGFMDYTDIKEWTGTEYFLEEFWRPAKDGKEVFIDGGGYTGDTIEEFIKWTKGNYQRVYSFEPQKDKNQIIRDSLWKWGEGKVRLYEYGLWSCRTSLSFQNGDNMYSGKIVDQEKEGCVIETVALDELIDERVTFLKMDIEGAEAEAIKGAKNIIQKDKPKLAICIYHKPNDLWEIPLMIHELVPEYKMYIRHMGIRCYGTILYATL